MVILKLKGGLGNQMFQFATAMAFSTKIGRPVKVDLNFFESKRKDITKRQYGLNMFDTKEVNLINQSNNKILSKLQSPFLKALKQSLRLKAIDWSRIEEYKKFRKIILDGDFFDLSPLENNRNIVLSIFKFNEALLQSSSHLLNDARSRQSVSIHIRRGDYLNAVNKNIYHACDKKYYLSSIDYIRNKIDDPFFYIFSDDIEWVKNELKFDKVECAYIDVNAANKDMVEFLLMAHCKHNIIANSTYSWWAAFLNDELHKIVIAPKNWYKDEGKNEMALRLIPKDWIII